MRGRVKEIRWGRTVFMVSDRHELASWRCLAAPVVRPALMVTIWLLDALIALMDRRRVGRLRARIERALEGGG